MKKISRDIQWPGRGRQRQRRCIPCLKITFRGKCPKCVNQTKGECYEAANKAALLDLETRRRAMSSVAKFKEIIIIEMFLRTSSGDSLWLILIMNNEKQK
jgi:hypothetical protein